MGNSTSSSTTNEQEEDEDRDDRFDGIDTLGYRVLGVQPESPASSAGLVSFFDFLVGCDGQMLLGTSDDDDEEDNEYHNDVDFPALLRDSVGKEIEILVWNIKSQDQRLVKITPSDTWGGTGLLGVTIRLDNYAEADERLIRVLSVEHNSPAAIAGLSPLTDYLLGTTADSFDSANVLASVLERHADHVMEIYVYNTESDVVRVVALMPTLSWGGRGLLGAEIGMGYLHRIPHQCRHTLGTSVERRVRLGHRPGSFPPDASSTSTSTTTSNAAAAPTASVPSNAGPDNNANLIDLTALTDSVKGTPVHLEPQMEMEPEPTDTNKNNTNYNNAEQTTAQNASEQTSMTAPPHPPRPQMAQIQQQQQMPTSEAAVLFSSPPISEPHAQPPSSTSSAVMPPPPTMASTTATTNNTVNKSSLFLPPPPMSKYANEVDLR